MYGPFHRLTNSSKEVRKILATGALCDMAPRNYFCIDIPQVKDYAGDLPPCAKGIEFETAVEPDHGHVPGKPTWAATPERPGVSSDGVYAKIKVQVLRQTVII